MPIQRARNRSSARSVIRPGAAALAAAVAVSLTLAGPLPSVAAPQEPAAPVAPGRQQAERKGNLDTRSTTLVSTRSSAKQLGRAVADRNALVRELGRQSLVSIDPLTGTPSHLSRLDGYLTKASGSSARSVALAYVRKNVSSLGLERSDLSSMSLNRDYVDVSGIHHLSWVQSFQGIRVFGNGLKANVSKSGRLISIQGAPVPGSLLAAVRADPKLSAADARKAAAGDVGGRVADAEATTTRRGLTTRWSNDDYAKQVWFLTPRGLRLAWSTYVQAGGTLNYQHVIDADTGAVLYRKDLLANDRGDALVYKNYPGAARGGTQTTTNFVDRKWLSKTANNLSGKYVNAWADVDDTNDQRSGITVDTPGVTGGAQYELSPFPEASTLCGDVRICTWDPNTALSWVTNHEADSTQAFYMGSQFHDYLLKSPIGFTVDAGNFEAAGGDAVQIHGLDGANTDNGLPDIDHVDNANMSTPPDGIPPTMQMYLWHVPGATAAQDPYLPISSTFDPSILLHEYTHGLSNRLAVDVDGSSTLNSLQAGSMGEGWSDYYAMDFLAARKLQRDPAGDGNFWLGAYVNPTHDPGLRSLPIDCPVASTAAGCKQPLTGLAGGYTYADLSAPNGSPEVHGVGEIWVQTLWDIRTELGRTVTNTLVTRGLELAPADPSILDMRNAILQADRTVYAGKYASKLWAMFAERGMGYFAGTFDSSDGTPGASFARPPRTTATTTLSGVVDPGAAGRGLAGAVVDLDGSVDRSVIPGSFQAVTDSDGAYSLRVPAGSYPEVVATSAGYERVAEEVTVDGATVQNFSLRRIWSSTAGGASVVDFTGPDFTPFGCGPADLLDGGIGEGWGSTTGNDAGDPTATVIPKSLTIQLPTAVDIYTLGIDPSATCGDAGSSSTGDYRVEASVDGTTWETIQSGTFTVDDRLLADYPVGPVTGARFVRVTMLSPQVPNFATNCPAGLFTGCSFMDMTDFRVYGRATQ